MNILKRAVRKAKKILLTYYNSPRYFAKVTDDLNWKGMYFRFCKTQKIKENWVFYESHAGASMLCNPLALFKEFEKRPDFKEYLHIWTIADDSEIEYLRNEYKHYKNVLFVKYQSVGYAYFVAKSKYLINNTSFVNFFSKRKGQVYLSTWHSITVKSLGYDTPDGVRLVKNMLRNLLMADYVISPNEFMTDIFNNSFRLREIFQGKYIEEGFPRNDMVVKKPVLYLYPENDMMVKVTFDNKDKLLSTYPKYKDEWNVFAKKDGKLIDENGREYYALYWDENIKHKEKFETGFYVKSSDSIRFLEEKLFEMGFTDREANEFIMYWLPIMEQGGDNLVHFHFTEERQEQNKINIEPKVDSLFRVSIEIKKVNKKVSIKEQKIERFERYGFSALEWGGSIIK